MGVQNVQGLLNQSRMGDACACHMQHVPPHNRGEQEGGGGLNATPGNPGGPSPDLGGGGLALAGASKLDSRRL